MSTVLTKIAIENVSTYFQEQIMEVLRCGNNSFKSSFIYQYSPDIIFNFFAMFGLNDSILVSLMKDGTTPGEISRNIGTKIAEDVTKNLSHWYETIK